MTAKSEPNTWRILPTKGGQFQWAVVRGDPRSGSEWPPKTLVPEEDEKCRPWLPSMMDLLLQAEQSTYSSNKSSFLGQQLAIPPKSVDVRSDNCGGGVMFSTGSGRTLSVQQSSVQKARSLIEEEDVTDKASCGGEGFSMFRTGLGKFVQVRQASIKKAAALLEVTNNKEGILACEDALPGHSLHEAWDTGSACPTLKFHTAGGRSISISSNALKRARNLLNDPELEALEGEAKANNALTSSTSENDKLYNESSCNIKRVSLDSLHEGRFMNKNVFDTSSVKQLCSTLMAPITSALSNLADSKNDHHLTNTGSCSKPPNEALFIAHRKVPCSRMIRGSSSAGGALVDISNHTGSNLKNKSWINGEKKRLGKESSSSSFKKPRTSGFTAPLKYSSSGLAATVEAAPPSTSVNYCCRARVSSRYPFQEQRKKLREFFGASPGRFSVFENIPDRVRCMNPDNAEKFRFRDTYSSTEFGPEAFQEMLLQSGALLADTSEKWVANHYKWIVWKLACLERCYPYEAIGKLLTVSNVLEELKYRYEREVNYGHRSALKKILDGDVSPSSMMILCISAIRSHSGPRTDVVLSSSDLREQGKKLNGFGINRAVKIELTDGWYSLDATLDGSLSKQLLAGKLFVGQKLRLCGAALCGWVEPISPLEASNSVSLLLHINGTYRAHWADSLGFCKGIGAPLAFRCIKCDGGKVPRTLVGVTRLYPVLYKERLLDGGSVVRSESLEKKILELNSQRRSDIAEEIISKLEDAPVNVNDSDGAKLLRILESSAEPEVLMAGMSSDQLTSFSSYQAKQEALRQANLHNKIEKALEEAGLGSRDVAPFMRVRVIGLTIVDSTRKGSPREGLITIWNPTEKQKLDLVEGQIYSVSWLAPFCGSSDFLYLQSRGPSSEWIPLPATDSKKYESFFIPRQSVYLSNLGELPLASEFDISAVVVHVGEAYLSGRHKKQWIFVSDGSGGICNSLTEDEHDSLLAISFCSPIFGNDSLAPIISRCLSGNTVGFCNLIKRARDRSNHLWVAEATENSTYFISDNISSGSHLKGAADSALKWANASSLALKKLQERVLSIIGDHGI